jgi:prolyl 4-hydroxylase
MLSVVGMRLGYLPLDCTPFSYRRPRKAFSALVAPYANVSSCGSSSCAGLAEDEADVLRRCDLSSYTRRMRLFTRDGSRVRSLNDLAALASANDNVADLWVVPAGDHFAWPGEYIGRRVEIAGTSLPDGSPIVLETIGLEPRAFFIERFVSDEEADALVGASEPMLVESLGFGSGGKNEKTAARNSEQAWLECTKLAAVCDLDERIANTTKIPLRHLQMHADSMQVLRYLPDQHYHAHTDWFDPTMAPDSGGLKEHMNRYLTLLYYLNDVEEGGHTVFPRGGPTGYGPDAPINDFSDCDRGLKVRPRKGSAILWYNLLAPGNNHEGIADHMSLHGGCDVVTGIKWAANKWVYNTNWSRRNSVGTELEVDEVVADDDNDLAVSLSADEAVQAMRERATMADKDMDAAREVAE